MKKLEKTIDTILGNPFYDIAHSIYASKILLNLYNDLQRKLRAAVWREYREIVFIRNISL